MRLGEGERSGPHSPGIPLSLSKIVPRCQQAEVIRSQDSGVKGSPVRVRHQSCSWECRGNDSHPKATPLALITPEYTQISTPQHRKLTPQQGVSSAARGDREFSGWSYCISPGLIV